MYVSNYISYIEFPARYIDNTMYVPISSISHTNRYGKLLKNNIVYIYDLDKYDGKLKGLFNLQLDVQWIQGMNYDYLKSYEMRGSGIGMGYSGRFKHDIIQSDFKDNKELNKKFEEFNKLADHIKYNYSEIFLYTKVYKGEFEAAYSSYPQISEDTKNLEKLYDEIFEIYVQNGYI